MFLDVGCHQTKGAVQNAYFPAGMVFWDLDVKIPPRNFLRVRGKLGKGPGHLCTEETNRNGHKYGDGSD